MKRVLKYLLLTLALTFLVACNTESSGESAGDGETSSDDYTVGYVINNLNDTFQTYIMNAAEERADEFGMTMRIENAEEDLIKQQDSVDTLIQNNVDALIVVPVDTSAMEPITEAAQNAGIPLVYVNRNPYANQDNMPEGTYYVGYRERQAGLLQGEYVGELLDGEGGIAILMGILGQEGQVERTAGVNESIEENYPNMNILAEETAEWQRDQAVSIAENWILAYGDDLNAILANNDEMALGAIQATESTGREDIVILGVDATQDALEAIENERLDGSVRQSADLQGNTAMEIFDTLRNDGEPEETITLLDFELVTEENLSEFK